MDISEEERKANTKLLIEAAKNGDCRTVKKLIPVSDLTRNHCSALYAAAENGHKECVEILIPVSPIMAEISYALQLAAENGHKECVELLIPVSHPTQDFSVALRVAAEKSHTDIVEMLIPVSDVDAAKIELKSWGQIKEIHFIEMVETEMRLNSSIAENYANARDDEKRRM